MEIEELKKVLIESIEELYDKDFHLITHNLSERSIAHRLAVYIEKKISELGLKVDCEYNGDAENDAAGYRKRISVLREDLIELGRKVSNEEEIQDLVVFPDIIIHERGKNGKNSLVIEIKKEFKGRSIDDQFDRKKLYCYTSDNYGNHLKYKLGAYVEFDTLIGNKSYRIDFYQEGAVTGKHSDPQITS